jgi:acyl carrier protein
MSISQNGTTFDRVQQVLMDALGVDEEEVKGDATIMGDLGAESIDFLDLVFRLEKEFGIKILRGDIFPEDVLSDPEFVSGGRITEAGLAELTERMPWLDDERIAENPNLQDFLTVDSICAYIDGKIAAP